MSLRMSAAQAAALVVTPPGARRGAVRGSSEAGGACSGAVGNKFNARRTEVEGIVFDSKREAARYRELVLLEAAKKISDLRTKCAACVFDLTVNGVKVSRYTADFVYTENGKRIVEDVKSGPTRTRAYVMRRKLMLACHGIEIRETT